jgi:hypothetical protein
VNAHRTDAPEPRFFSLEEASRMLPLVRRIVEDITVHYRALEPVVSRFRGLTAGQRGGNRGRALEAEAESKTAEIDDLVRELHELGCHFKGFDDGLVDWYSYYAGRPVFLCWKLGEPAIEWWHQIDTGYAGRQPILPSQRSAFRSTPGPERGD